jgi:DNA-binding MarR family transcriptional regulator
MLSVPHAKDGLAIELTLALKHIRARLREESGAYSKGLAVAQLSILQRLQRIGPMTAASLAASEHVSQQAIAQNVVPLKSDGFVTTRQDSQDGRKILIIITPAGSKLRRAIINSRNAWVAQAIDATLNEQEKVALHRAIALLEKLANSDLKTINRKQRQTL